MRKISYGLIAFFICSILSLHAQPHWSELNAGVSASLGGGPGINAMCLDSRGVLAVSQCIGPNSDRYIAKWDGQWSRLGPYTPSMSFNDDIYTLTETPQGVYYAGGAFNWGSPPVIDVAALFSDSDTYWANVGGPPCSSISTLCSNDSGNVYAAGVFNNSQGYYYVASMALGWGELGAAHPLNANDYIEALYTDHSGHVFAGGAFTDSSGYKYVAQWNGTSWSELGVGNGRLMANGTILAITGDRSGNIYAAGAFADSSSRPYVAKWDGSSWSELGTGSGALNVVGRFNSLGLDGAGNLYATGRIQDTFGGHTYVYKWDGTNWSTLGQGSHSLHINSYVYAMCVDSAGDVYIGGSFTDTIRMPYVNKWDGTDWAPVGMINVATTSLQPNQPNHSIAAMTCNADGTLFAASTVDPAGYGCVVKWNGQTPLEVGTGLNALNAQSQIKAICHDTSGNVYVSAQAMDTVRPYGYSRNSHISKWDGATWIKYPRPRYVFVDSTGVPGRFYGEDIRVMCTDEHNDLYIVADFYNMEDIDFPYYHGSEFLKWNKVTNSWDTLYTFKPPVAVWDHTPYQSFSPHAMCSDHHGNIFLCGNIGDADGRVVVVKWDGVHLTNIISYKPNSGRFMNYLASDSAGNVYISGEYSHDTLGRTYNLAVYTRNGSVIFDSTGFNIFAMSVNPSNRLYLSSDTSVYIWSRQTWRNIPVNAYPFAISRKANAMCTNGDNDIYLGSGNIVTYWVYGAVNDTRTGASCVLWYHDTSSLLVDTITFPSSTMHLSNPNSVADIKQDEGYFSLYPNPSEGRVMLVFKNAMSGRVSLMDIEGRKIFAWSLNNESEKSLDLSQYQDGVYIIKVETANMQPYTKMMVLRK